MTQPQTYWQGTRRLTGVLVALWFVLTFGTIFFARELSGLRFFGWPLSFYLLAQGVILVYAVLIAFYAWRMDKFEQQFQDGERHGDE